MCNHSGFNPHPREKAISRTLQDIKGEISAFRAATETNFAALRAQGNRLHGDVSEIRGRAWEKRVAENPDIIAEKMVSVPTAMECLWALNAGLHFHKCAWYEKLLHEYPDAADRDRLRNTDVMFTFMDHAGGRVYVPAAITHVANQADVDRAARSAELLRAAACLPEVTPENCKPVVLATRMDPQLQAYAVTLGV